MGLRTILLTTEDTQTRKSLETAFQEILEDTAEILTTDSAEDGLGLMYRLRSENREVELVVAEQALPGIPGSRFLEIVHSQFPSVIKILLAGTPNLEDALYAINNAGLDRYVPTPWDPEDLKFTVTALLRQSTMRRTNESLLVDLQRRNEELRAALGELKEAKQALEEGYLSAIESLAVALEAKDRYTAGHSQRVARFAKMIARGVGLTLSEVRTVGQIGLLHDIGKIGMDEKVLNKPGRLTDEEFELIKTHPVIGAQILEPVRSLKGHVAGIKHHHESWDGSGYPSGLQAEDIPLHARIVCLADAFDAMTSNRSYRPRRSLEEAIKEMELQAGVQFDPNCVAAFVAVLRGGSEPASTPLPRAAATG